MSRDGVVDPVQRKFPTCQYCQRHAATRLIKVRGGKRWKCEYCFNKSNKPGVF